jgi:hypothetical protein
MNEIELIYPTVYCFYFVAFCTFTTQKTVSLLPTERRLPRHPSMVRMTPFQGEKFNKKWIKK